MTNAVALHAEGDNASGPFRSDADRLAYMESPLGQALNFLTSALTSSPINDAKIWLTKVQAGEYDSTVVGQKVDTYIKENAVVMFSFSKCPFCLKAKAQLDEMGAKYLAVELDQMGDAGKHIRAELAERTKRTSMPNIFIGGQGVGGCNDGPGIMTLQKQGELAPMLQKVGALR